MNTRDLDSVDRREGKSASLRVGIVGCGRVAKHHVRFIAETENTKIVGFADKDEANARELAKDCGTDNFYGSLDEMLASVPMDVLHILTPPKFHYEQAVAAINRGIHVLIEKPCTLSAKDTKDLYRRAAEKGVLICPDFIQIFHPNFQHAISLIASGDLGRVIHVESQLGVDATLREFREAIGLFWSFKLPGGVLHNYITHPLYLVLHWLGRLEGVTVINKSHGSLPQGLTDHLIITLQGERTTGSVTLSCAITHYPITFWSSVSWALCWSILIPQPFLSKRRAVYRAPSVA
jgi:predicted dehydrogenase